MNVFLLFVKIFASPLFIFEHLPKTADSGCPSAEARSRARPNKWGRTKPKSKKPNAMKHGKQDLRQMANIGRRCTIEVAGECIIEQNRPPN